MPDDPRRAAFETLIADAYEPLQRYLRRRCPTDDVDDVLNDTLLTIWRRLDDVPAAMALPWCYGVARRCLANHRRGDERRLRLVRRAATALAVWPAGGSDDTDVALHVALGGLGESDREVIRLWAWEHLEPREIAEALDLTPNAVSVRLSRIKRRLAAELARQDPALAGHKAGQGTLELEP